MSEEQHEPTSFPLRLPRSLRQRARAAAKTEGISINFLITLALADYLSKVEAKAESAAQPVSESRKDPGTHPNQVHPAGSPKSS